MVDQKKFIVHSRKLEDIVCLDLHGFLDAHTAPDLESAIQQSIDKGSHKILVNFKALDYISSAGLGVFMAFIEDVRNYGGDIKLSSMNEKVFSVFDLLGFPMLFDIDGEENLSVIKFSKMKIVDEERKA
jgi:anti-sigma B factor antagonist